MPESRIPKEDSKIYNKKFTSCKNKLPKLEELKNKYIPYSIIYMIKCKSRHTPKVK